MVPLPLYRQHLVPRALSYPVFFFFLFSTRSRVTKALTLVLLLTLSNLADLTCPSLSFGFPIFKMKELE